MRTLEEYIQLNYRFSLRKDEDNDYVVEVTELPGCVADGRTPDEAMENVYQAMRSWIASRMEAGLPIPEPREAVEYSGRFVVRMAKSLHRTLSERAAVEGVSLNHYVVSALSEYLGRSTTLATQEAATVSPATHSAMNWLGSYPLLPATLYSAYVTSGKVLTSTIGSLDLCNQHLLNTIYLSNPQEAAYNSDPLEDQNELAGRSRSQGALQLVRRGQAA